MFEDTFTFVFWPLTPSRRYKSTHCLSQRIMLQIAIELAHQSFLYFTVIFHPKGKQSLCYQWLYMSKIIPKMISLNFVGLLNIVHRNQHDFWLCHLRDMPLSTRWLEDNKNILWTLNYVFGFKKTCPFYGQFGHKYDRACISDGIILHFINFRKSLTAEIGQF